MLHGVDIVRGSIGPRALWKTEKAWKLSTLTAAPADSPSRRSRQPMKCPAYGHHDELAPARFTAQALSPAAWPISLKVSPEI